MKQIQVLDQAVANMIAAGEVVERPASVVKELVENAIDANAQAVTIEIKNGGISYIRVSDNGNGIRKEDTVVAFERHATSKIHSADDLDSILTLGFRGEALASIAAVSQIELITKSSNEDEGTHVVMNAGKLISQQDIGCPAGTTVVVKNLFYNTPARMKFLKKDSTEAGHVGDIINRMILGHPEISFRYINNGKEIVFTPGDNKLISCIYSLYGKDYAKSMVPVKHSDQGIEVWGLAGKSNIARANRSLQSFFINGRYIKSNVLTYAVQEAYKNLLMVNRFPVVVLHLNINPALIDVNVHPTKMEVKFSNEKQVFQAIYWAVKNALYADRDIPAVTINKKNIFQYNVSDASRTLPMIKSQPDGDQISIGPSAASRQTNDKNSTSQQPISKQSISGEKEAVYDVQKSIGNLEHKPNKEVIVQPQKDNTVQSVTSKIVYPEAQTAIDFKIVGQVFNTYIILEKDGQMLMIDQHAAHERLKYERLLEHYKNREIHAQTLLVPIVMQLSGIEFESIKENMDFFKKIGFEIENFGNNSIVIRQTPEAIDEDKLKGLFLEIIELIQHSNKEAVTEMEAHALHMIACKSAIKANKMMQIPEMERLVKDVFNLENINTCPHGRPIILSLSRYQIEKEFKRVGK